MKNWKKGSDTNSCIKIADGSFLQGTTTVSKDFYGLFGITESSNESINAEFRFAGISYSVKISKKKSKSGNPWQFRIPNELNFALFGTTPRSMAKQVIFNKVAEEAHTFDLSVEDNPDYLEHLSKDKDETISYQEIIKTTRKKSDDKKQKPSSHPLNLILYGPPGTGKTYNTINYAVAIIENEDIKTIQDQDYNKVKKRYVDYREQNLIEFITFHQSYGYEDFIEGIKPVVRSRGQITYKIEPGIFKKFCDFANPKISQDSAHQYDVSKPHVFIIDEINRGNVSKIFGELITSIEDTKRIGETEELMVTLPYSKEQFGVPRNLYILGTMNTADRSLARIDTALRRRFTFKELVPDHKLLIGNDKKALIVEEGGVKLDIQKMLDKMNKRIELLLSREHTIGHAYFLPLQKNPTIDTLKTIFQNKIMPLLQEYFYDDYRKIQLVLGDTADSADINFIKRREKTHDLFKNSVSDIADARYELNETAFGNAKSYLKIYE